MQKDWQSKGQNYIVRHFGLSYLRLLIWAHVSYDPAGPDAVIVAQPALVVRVLPCGQDVLVAQVVGPLVQDPGPALHTDGVAATDVDVELRTVVGALVISTLEVFIFI